MYLLTEDWFSHNIPIFDRYLSQYKNKKVKFLEVGSYEGRSAIWMLENILNKDSSLICVDPGYSGKKEILRKNLANFPNVTIIEEPFHLASKKLLWEEFDFIYIDGDHSKYSVYQDGVLALPMLQTGGIIAFDDYLWKLQASDGTSPKEGIDKFYFENQNQVMWIHKAYQAWFLKK